MSITAEKISKSERPIEKEVLLDVRESFRVLLAKNIPVRTVQSIMTIQREISYQVAAINLHNQRVDCFSTKGRTARKRARKVSYELKKLEETIG